MKIIYLHHANDPQEAINASIQTYLSYFNDCAMRDKHEHLSNGAYRLARIAKQSMDDNTKLGQRPMSFDEFHAVVICLCYYLYFVHQQLTKGIMPSKKPMAEHSLKMAFLFLLGTVHMAKDFKPDMKRILVQTVQHCPIPVKLQKKLIAIMTK